MVETLDLLESYAAFYIAIEYGLENVDLAFKMLDEALEDPFGKKIVRGKVLEEHKPVVINRNNALTVEDTENMARLRERKVPYKDIGAMYGISPNSVYERVRRLKKRKESGKKPRRPYINIVAECEKLDLEQFSHFTGWQDEIDMIKLKKQGLTYKEIGKMFGINDTNVHVKIKRFLKKFVL